MLRLLAFTLLSGCGRISFETVRVADPDASGDGTGEIDGPPGDGPVDTLAVRACLTEPAYVTSAGLANTYREGVETVTWLQARANCMAEDADLWVVESSLEQNAFTGDWTGITDDANENTWVMLDGSVATFLPFLAGQPDGGNAENCIRVDSLGFEDRACTDLRDYVCECQAP